MQTALPNLVSPANTIGAAPCLTEALTAPPVNNHICEPSTGALTTPPVNNHLMQSIQTGRLFRPGPVNPIQHAAVTSGESALVSRPNAG